MSKIGLIPLLKTQTVQLICRLLLAGIFILAGLEKIANPHTFAGIIYEYRILPDTLVYAAALYLPWLEIVAALYLLSGFMVRPAASILTTLLVVFLAALTFNALRGLDIDCGCFSVTSAENGGNLVWAIVRDGLFILPGLVILFFSPTAAKDG
jgi:uncharacterized membrane protein YphA (DoxX/SURF4 family)